MNKRIKTTMAIALIVLAATAATQTTQAHGQKSFFVQHGNGQTKEIQVTDNNQSVRERDFHRLVDKAKTTAIIFPKQWSDLTSIDVVGITNLTRIVLEYQTDSIVTIYVQRTKMDEGEIVHTAGMSIKVEDNGFLGPIRRIRIDPNNAEDMAKPEAQHFQNPLIRAFEDPWGTPVTEISWSGEGILQISKDNEQWQDVPLSLTRLTEAPYWNHLQIIRWPQFVANHEKQFFRIKPEEEEKPEETNQ